MESEAGIILSCVAWHSIGEILSIISKYIAEIKFASSEQNTG